MLVQIRDYDYLYQNRSVDPSVNDDMLRMAGESFFIDEMYIDDSRWYEYRGWKWLGDWLKASASEHSTQRGVVDDVCPTQVVTPDIVRLVERLKSVTMPSDLQSITIKSNMPELKYTINEGNPFQWDLIFLPRESREIETQVFVKFSGAVQYNITRYVMRSTTGFHIDLLDTREKEDLIPRVLEGLFEAYKDILIKDANVVRTTDCLGLGHWFNKIYRHPSNPLRMYSHYENVGYDNVFINIIRMTKQETFKIELTDHNVPDDTLLDSVYACANGFMYSMDRATYDTHFTEHKLKTCPVFGINYFGVDPVRSVFMMEWIDGQQHIIVSRERQEQYEDLYERLADSDHEWSSIPQAIYYGRKWYSQAGYERELAKAEAYLDFNVRLEGQRVVYAPTGDSSYTDDDEIIADYDYEPQVYLHGDNNDLHLGVELEIDRGGEYQHNAALIQPVLGWKHAYCMHDGSLNDGFEIAFMPMTLDYAESIKSRVHDAFNLASYLGYKSHNTSTCGLHIHFDRWFLGASKKTQNQKASYLALIMERNWEKFVKFSRRNYDRIDQWAKKMDLVNDIYADDTEDDAQVKFADKYGNGDKYVALNTSHYNTYELRIFRGTLKPETFYATMQFVDNLVRISKDCTSLAKAQQITFADIIDYKHHKELIEYVNTRGILTREYKEYEGE